MGKGASSMRADDPTQYREGRTEYGGASFTDASDRDRTADDADSPDEIRLEIAETRVEMSQTVDALQAKLAPDTLVEQAKEALSEVTERAVQEAKERAREAIQEATELAKDAVHDATVGKAEHMVSSATETAMDTGSSLMGTIRANPIPAAIAAVSLGWLFTKRQG